MGMAGGIGCGKIRPSRSDFCNWCPDCGAEFTGNSDDWCKANDISTGTATPQYVKVADIQKGVCICCGSKNVKGPI